MKRGITQAELARQLGWQQPRISDYYRGIKTPTDASIKAMAQILDVEPTELSAVFLRERLRKTAKTPDTEG